jgi:hypothetical protein
MGHWFESRCAVIGKPDAQSSSDYLLIFESKNRGMFLDSSVILPLVNQRRGMV